MSDGYFGQADADRFLHVFVVAVDFAFRDVAVLDGFLIGARR